MKTIFNMGDGFSTNSPMWAKRLRVGLGAFFAGIIMYSELLAPLLGMDVPTFDKFAGFGGFLSTIIFSMFGVAAETPVPENEGNGK